jgi:hypothetical protein
MANKEATARIKINKLIEKASWRFFANERGPANIQLEPASHHATMNLCNRCVQP